MINSNGVLMSLFEARKFDNLVQLIYIFKLV